MVIHGIRLFRAPAAVAMAAVLLWAASSLWAQGTASRPAAPIVREAPGGGDAQPSTGTGAPGAQSQPGDTGGARSGDKDGGKGGGLFGGMTPIFIILGVFLLMYLFMGRNRKKQESQRKQMLANLKKGDKITTIGGICATVVEPREDEIIVKIDENTRMRIARWAIRGVGEEAKAEKPEDKDKK